MSDLTRNDNDAGIRPSGSGEPDPQGQAAMLLIESLLHGLISRSVITVADAVEIVEVASEVKYEIAEELDESQQTAERSLAILHTLHASISIDLPRS